MSLNSNDGLFTVHAGELGATAWSALEALASHRALAIDGVFGVDECAAYVRAVQDARAEWVSAFGNEQFSLGRAFYTDLEQDRCGEYFRGARASDASVERHLPGMQAALRELVARVTGGRSFPRRGFCGPGVHIFPAGEKVARSGGVVHFDTEGLTPHHLRARKRALSVIVMLGLPESGAAIRVWDVFYAGRDRATASELRKPSSAFKYSLGGAIVIDSYRLHQILPFQGQQDRISATVHAAEVDPGCWETWF
ncbi:MAG TPA: hypothetical protein VFQ61_07920 [Polyangiaceae bacterium]|nr:hypothetical protein [Polyangiaceae bacterium]